MQCHSCRVVAALAPKSGEILGLLEQFGATMAQSLANTTSPKDAAIKSFAELVAAMSTVVDALTASMYSLYDGSSYQVI